MNTDIPQNQAPVDPLPDFQTAFTAAEPPAEVTVPEQVEPTAIEPTDPEPAPNPYFEQARELGIELGQEATADDLLQELQQRYREQQPFAQYGQSLMPHAQQISDMMAQAAQPPQPEQPPEEQWSPDSYFQQKWNTPEWKDQYSAAIDNGVVQRDPNTGLYVAAPGFEQMAMAILPGLNDAYRHQTQGWQGIMRGNPYQNFYEALHEPMQRSWNEDIRAEVSRQLGRASHMNAVQQFEQENSNWMYEQTPQGYVTTERGQKFLDDCKMLQKNGMADPGAIIATAMRMQGQLPEAAPEGGEQPGPDTIPINQTPAQPQQSPQQSFLKNALDRAGHSASSGASTPSSPDVPVQMSQGDLDSTFTNAFRSRKQG